MQRIKPKIKGTPQSFFFLFLTSLKELVSGFICLNVAALVVSRDFLSQHGKKEQSFDPIVFLLDLLSSSR